ISNLVADSVFNQDFTLGSPTGELQGAVLLSDGTPLIAGTVELLDSTGQVVLDQQGNPLTATTDGAGEYDIQNIDSVALGRITSLRISAPSQGLIPWNVASPEITPGDVTFLDFQYGNVVVTVAAAPGVKPAKLNG